MKASETKQLKEITNRILDRLDIGYLIGSPTFKEFIDIFEVISLFSLYTNFDLEATRREKQTLIKKIQDK